ncbi:MAG TPA: hypothetical protein P5081_17565 [Phycisphaerae bacterium]|nr:hypothetical protein [Phycisphaerae bacterium]HRW54681.1 hypothetical protein [Phycisphaerae bacterium]
MIKLQERRDLEPICPHCEKPLKEVAFRELPTWLGRRYIYFCPNCRKCLSISHRRGYLVSM